MELALALAKEALRAGEIPVGCVIVQNDAVIAQSRNRREELRDPTAHAEILALRAAAKAQNNWRLSGATLYVTLEPCPMCAGAISQARIGRLVFGVADPSQGCDGSVYRIPEDPAFVHFCKTDAGVLEDECQALLDDFFTKVREVRQKPFPNPPDVGIMI